MIKDDLVVWLDGKDNTNTGTYDENASTWINKVDPSHNWTLLNSYWKDNSVYCKGSRSGLRHSTNNPYHNSPTTYQVIVSFNSVDTTRSQWIFGKTWEYDTPYVGVQLINKQIKAQLVMSGGPTYSLTATGLTVENGKKYCITLVTRNGEFELYVDGRLYDSLQGVPGTIASGANFTIGDTPSSNIGYSDAGLLGQIYSFRVYHRRLTSEEVNELYLYDTFYLSYEGPGEPPETEVPGIDAHLISRIQNKNQVYNIKDTVARVEKIDKYENSTATGIVDFYNGLQIQGAYIRYDQETNTVIFE